MKSMMRSPMRESMRGPTQEEAYAFSLRSIPGGLLYDDITKVSAITSISGTRYGVVNGVVTQFAPNQPPIEEDGLRGCPAFTQSTLYSEDLTNASWLVTNCAMSLSGTFQGSNVHKLTENTSASAQRQLRQLSFASSIPDSSVIGLSFIAKRNGRDAISIMAVTKANTYLPSFMVNLIDGSIITAGSFTAYSVTDMGSGFYRIFVAYNVGTGATAPFFFIRTLDSSNSPTYTGDGVSGLLLGQVSHVNFGVAGVPFIPPYVPTTAIAVSCVAETAAAATGTSFDLDDLKLGELKNALRGPSAQGHLELSFRTNFTSAWFSSGANTYVNILAIHNTVNATGALFIQSDLDRNMSVRMSDGTNYAVCAIPTVVPGQTLNISVDWGAYPTGTKMRITVNGVRGALVNFLGTFGTNDLRFFYGSLINSGHIVPNSFKISSKPQW